MFTSVPNKPFADGLCYRENDLWIVSESDSGTYVVLIETGIRVGELCGLTISGLDFDNRRINIQKQLIGGCQKACYIDKPKSKSGNRVIPMTDNVYHSLMNIIKKRNQCQHSIDGVNDFLFISSRGKPLTSDGIQHMTNVDYNKYKKLHSDSDIPKITPHVLRHTFCSNYD